MAWKPDICVYHGGCDDGFGAAWVVNKRWPEGVTYVPAGYRKPIEWPCEIADKNILFVDFSLKRDAMVQLAKGYGTGAVPRSIVVLDHHKTAEAELREWNIGPVQAFSLARTEEHVAMNNMENMLQIVAHFDMEHSGARMAWDFCFPAADWVPHLIMYIEDRDLWHFHYGDTTRAISAALRTYPQTFEQWGILELCLDRLLEEGEAVLRGHRKNVEAFIRNRYWTTIAGHSVPVVNVPYHYASDCADAILKEEPEAPFCAAWFTRGDGKVQFSLRSTDDRVDVSAVAKAFGGGGHRNAAGFEMQTEKLP